MPGKRKERFIHNIWADNGITIGCLLVPSSCNIPAPPDLLRLLPRGMRKHCKKVSETSKLCTLVILSWKEKKKCSLALLQKITLQLITSYKAAQHVLIGRRNSVNSYRKHHILSKTIHGAVQNVPRQIIFFHISSGKISSHKQRPYQLRCTVQDLNWTKPDSDPRLIGCSGSGSGDLFPARWTKSPSGLFHSIGVSDTV